MRKIKKLLIGGLFCMGVALMFNSSESNAQGAGPLPGNHICCPSGTGCVDRQGFPWLQDETITATTCTKNPILG
ncbi:hypothetical protein [Algoriphagus marinus]|uniref:hypothetical protein n=1 Tax=Algoriphagus marinus TaxID=1925762 RepID=UPI00094B877C|nr:hypothetical protein [Algoriphagus marinus]